MEVILFDDDVAAGWMPFARTRPVGELLFGCHTFRERAELLFGACRAHVAPRLAGFEEPGCAPVVAAGDVSAAHARLFLSSRAVPDWNHGFEPGESGTVSVGGRVAGCFLAAAGSPPAGFFARPESFRVSAAPGGAARFEAVAGADVEAPYALPGRVLPNVWDLIVQNAAQIDRDFAQATARAPAAGAAEPPAGVHVIGGSSDRIRMAQDVTLEPGVILDVSSGPIWLDAGVTVRAFSRLQGPAFIGRESTLLGGPFSALSVGPQCKVHGEVEESVILGYANKAHDGFLGHAYLGRWVNLGALTTNSDLKNNYGTIRLWAPRGEVDTGAMKIGCLLGDHVKTGIGVMLNTGTIIETGSNVFGAVQPPKYVPPFRWGSGADLVDHDFDRFLATARTVMARRGVVLADGHAALLRNVWASSRAEATVA